MYINKYIERGMRKYKYINVQNKKLAALRIESWTNVFLVKSSIIEINKPVFMAYGPVSQNHNSCFLRQQHVPFIREEGIIHSAIQSTESKMAASCPPAECPQR